MRRSRYIAVIDPAVRIAELDCFNRMVLTSTHPLTYHLPALGGTQSLARTPDPSGIILLGSSSSVYDNLPWQRPLEDWLMDQMEKGTPTLGLCYGHQLIAHLHGATIGFRTPDKTKRLGFDAIELDSKLWDGVSRKGKVFFSHREVVTSCPAGMRAMGKSAESNFEVLAHESRPVWTFQAHPEATAEFAINCGYSAPTEEKEFSFGHEIVAAFITQLG